MMLKDLNQEDKPREKLFSKGVKNLTNTELVSLILGKGSKNISILKLSQELLKNYSLNQLKQIETIELTKISGIGKSKACQIIGAIEFGKRVTNFSTKHTNKIGTPKKAYIELRNEFPEDQECLLALFLDSRNFLISKKTMFIGTINKQLISSREIIKHALALKAINIIIAHNHPSGNLTPSNADIRSTNKIKQSLELFNLNLNDHIIIGNNNFFSMKENFMI